MKHQVALMGFESFFEPERVFLTRQEMRRLNVQLNRSIGLVGPRFLSKSTTIERLKNDRSATLFFWIFFHPYF